VLGSGQLLHEQWLKRLNKGIKVLHTYKLSTEC
jgi:hypothetical protein